MRVHTKGEGQMTSLVCLFVSNIFYRYSYPNKAGRTGSDSDDNQGIFIGERGDGPDTYRRDNGGLKKEYSP